MTGHQEEHAPARLLVIQPDEVGRLDDFDTWLREDGVQIRTVRPYAGESVPAEVAEDAVLVLGGRMSSLDDAEYPWLEDIRVLLRAACDRDQPVLGICLGAQLMAQAHGGRVARGHNGVEAGLIRVHWRAQAGADPLVGQLADPFPAAAFHGDAVEVLPPGAQWLAESAAYPHQAFRVGRCSWGFQFHPEVNAQSMWHWWSLREQDDPDSARELRAGVAEFDREQATVRVGTRELARRFAGMIGRS